MSATPDAAASLARLEAVLRGYGSVLVCFSGGIDSALVLAVAHRVLGARALGLTAVGPALAEAERAEAVALAAEIGARHVLADSSEIDDPAYVANAPDRCFHCKSELYRVAEAARAARGFAVVANGTNLDDLGDYRPGLDAARAAGARSPLVEAELDKEAVRRVARHLGVRIWDKPAAACLASRIPYGTAVTRGRLGQIASLEAALRAEGIRQARVRWHAVAPTAEPAATEPPAIARVEVAADELERAFGLRERIAAAGRAAGFAYVTLDLEGYRTGSHNEVLSGRSLRVLG